MKYLLLAVFLCSALFTTAQNVGINVPIPAEQLHVDSTIKIGKNSAVTDSSSKNLLKFGDGNFVTIGEEFIDDQLNIKFGNLIFSKSTGSIGSGFIGLFTNTPTAAFDLNGSLRIRSAAAAAGKVLTSDALGNATWQPAGITLPFAATQSSATPLFSITNTSASGAVPTAFFSSTSTASGTNFTNGAAALAAELPGAVSGSYAAALRGVAKSTNGAGYGVIGSHTGSGGGVYGESLSGFGITAYSGSGSGIFATTSTGYAADFQSATGYAMRTNGLIQLLSINEGAGKVLTSDANGNASWQPSTVTFPLIRNAASAATQLTISNSGTGVPVHGFTSSIATGSVLTGITGVLGEVTPTNSGTFSAGVRGINRGTNAAGMGVVGYQAGGGYGVYGESVSGRGVYGTSSNGTGGEFVSTSGVALRSAGGVRMTGIGEGTAKVLTSDASGNATWQTPAAGVPQIAFSARLANDKALDFGDEVFLTGYSEEFDDGNNFNPATGVFTVPSTGLYEFMFDINVVETGPDTKYMTVTLNAGGSPRRAFKFISSGISSTSSSDNSISQHLKLIQGEQISLSVERSAASGNTINGGNFANTTRFEMRKIY